MNGYVTITVSIPEGLPPEDGPETCSSVWLQIYTRKRQIYKRDIHIERKCTREDIHGKRKNIEGDLYAEKP